MYQFGSGNLWGVGTAANPTPRKFAALQDVQVDFSYTVKTLYGQNSLPLTLARGAGKIDIKAKVANIAGGVFNDLFFNQTSAAGQTNTAIAEAGTVPTTPFQVTVTNSATWARDLGVFDVTAAKTLTRVASAPATGQYSVAAGIYTFAAADTTHQVQIDYEYTVVATGATITISNQLSGTTPTFSMALNQTFQGKQGVLKFNYVTSSKLMLPTKIEDFTIPEIDFVASADANGAIGFFSFGDA